MKNKKREKKETPKKREHLLVGNELEGKIDIAKSGDGFVIIEGEKKDIYIHRNNINTAFDGDIVKVKRVHNPKSTRKEGIVTAIIERKRIQILSEL
jgi:ribonuclease R